MIVDKKTISAVMSALGSRTSERKKQAARENGKRGGRPINPDSARQKKLQKSQKNA